MASKRGRGQPPKLTPEVQKEIITMMIDDLATPTEAAGALGIGRSTVFAWIVRGENEESGIYREFLDAIAQAKAMRAVRAKRLVVKHAKKHPPTADRAMQIAAPATIPQVRVQVTNELTNAIQRISKRFGDRPQLLDEILDTLSGEFGEGGAEPSESRLARADDSDGGEAVRATPTEPTAT
jgi:hypothetical protein